MKRLKPSVKFYRLVSLSRRFSLLLYAFAFNLRENVARAFILILTNVVIVFTTHSIATVGANVTLIELMLKLKWVGIVFLPATYLHFSDSLLP